MSRPSLAQFESHARRRSAQLIASISPRVRWFLFFLLLVPLLYLALSRINSASAEAVASFSTATSIEVGAGPYWAATFTKFGKPAIAVTNQDGHSVSVLYGFSVSGQFTGSFTVATPYDLVTASVPAPGPQQVVVGNLGQSPLPCLVIAAANANRVAVLLGNSDDSFVPTPVYYNVGNFPESVALGDVNGDGILDIIAANYGSSTISVLLGNSDRTFQPQQTYPTSANPESVVVADFNNDGKVDVATVNSGTNPGKVNVLLNVNGTFPNALTSDVGVNPFSLAFGDFNSDGKLDIVTANHGGGVSVLLNNGVRPFPITAPAPIGAGSAPISVAVADFNLDGKPDIAVSNSDNGGSVGILPNNNGSFQALQASDQFSSGPTPFFIAAGDFNTDGKPDIVAPNHPNPAANPGTISLLRNNATPFAYPPANDNFSGAVNVNGINAINGSLNGTNIGATHETDEPNHASSGGSSSVWYSWTAPANGAMTFDTFGSSFDTVLAIYKGTSVGSLTLVHSNDNDRGETGDFRNSSRVSFTAVAGTTYRIAIDGKQFSPPSVGNIAVNWYLMPSPKNDAFAAAQTIVGSSGAVGGSNAGATKETNEPDHANNSGGASVWYRWVPPSDGTATFNTTGSSLNALVAVYTGTIGNLQVVASNQNGPASFSADHTKTYFIAVDGRNGATDDFFLSWGFGTVPNQSFDQALLITGGSGGVSGPNPSSPLWYRWTPPTTGGFAFSSAPFQGFFNPSNQVPSTVSVYVGTTQPTLVLLGSNTGTCQGFSTVSCSSARVAINATFGVTYYITVSSQSLSNGNSSLSWAPGGPGASVPPNDNFTNATTISGYGGFTGGTLVGATLEANEPNHAAQQGGTGGSSVWYNWTAPRNINVSFSSRGSCAEGFSVIQMPTSIGVYQGSTVSQLVEVSKGIGNCVSTSSSFTNTPAVATFNAIEGVTYRISIDRKDSPSSYSLSWGPNSAPVNDAFLNALPLTGESGSVDGFTNFATSEPNEPTHGFSTSSFNSVWYNWTAPPTNGLVTFTVGITSFAGYPLAVYSGNSLQSLSPVVAGGHIKFFAVANSTYRIAVVTSTFDGKPFKLIWGRPASISGRVKDIRGVGIANIPIRLSGTTSENQTTDALGNYSFVDLIERGNYTVTPDRASFTFDFLSRTFDSDNPLVGNATNVDFVAQTPTYSITGQIKVNGVGVDNIPVTLTGTDIPPGETFLTKEGGNYSFTNLTTNGNYRITPSSSLYAFSADMFPANNFYEYTPLSRSQKGVDFTAAPVPKSLQVRSTNPATGAQITVSPKDNNNQGTAETPFNRVYNATSTVSLTASPTANGNNFAKWLKDSNDFPNNQSATVSVMMDADHIMTAVYQTPTHTLTIASENVAGGVDITVLPTDNNSQTDGKTEFTRLYDVNRKVSLTAPLNAGNGTFQRWLKDGAEFSNSLATEVTMDVDHKMTAVYLTTSSQTPTGQNVKVELNGVTVNFTNVTTAGTTTILPISPTDAGLLPNGYQLTSTILAFDISTTATVQPPISVCFNVGSVNDPILFGQLRVLHKENGTLVDRTTSQNFANKTVCATVSTLSPFVLVSTTVQQLQLLLEDSATVPTQIVALDNIMLLRDPLPVVNMENVLMGADKNTRLMVFVKGLPPGDTAAAVTVHLAQNGQGYDVTGENLFSLPGFDFSQLTLRLPDTIVAGTCTIELRAHGQVSNLGTFRIK